MKKKLLSIITPSYNCVDKIENTILSVLKQDMKFVEYIIVDGKSTDGTNEILEKYKTSLVYISEPDKGIYDAMNKGISMSNGEYLFFLGAGDYLYDNIIIKLKGLLVTNKFDFIYGNVYMKDLDKIYNGKYNKYKIMLSNICHQSIFYNKRIFSIIGNYNLKYKSFADHELNIKCFGNNKITKNYIKEIICEYEGNGFSSKYQDDIFFNDIYTIIKGSLGYFYYNIYFFRSLLVKLLVLLNLKNKIVIFLSHIKIKMII